MPPLLLTLDMSPHEEVPPERPDTDPQPGPERPVPPERNMVLRFPYPFGLFIEDGERHYYSLTSFLLSDPGLSDGGPLGRSLSSEPDVRDDPLVNFAADPEPGGLSAFPFQFYDNLVDHADLPDLDGHIWDRDIGLMPLFMYGDGDDDAEDDYLVVAPFGGTTRGILGKEEITWYGFPFPAYLKVKDRAYDSYHVAWPLVNWLEGPRHDGFRVLPFYAHYERRTFANEPLYEKTWLLWPLLTWQRLDLDRPISTDIFFFFPFYGSVEGAGFSNTTVLWPFFRYEEDREARTWELRAPFPFFQVAGGPDSWKLDLWPLFGVKEREGYHRHFALWPIWRYEDLDRDHYHFEGQWLLPLYWRTYARDHEEGTWEHKVHGLPLFHYLRRRDGSVDVHVPSPYWRDDDEGFWRVVAPFFRLYHYHRDPTGGVEHQALLGLVSWRDLPAVPERELPSYWRLSLLFGLFQLREREDEMGLRLLWFVPEITWGGEG